MRVDSLTGSAAGTLGGLLATALMMKSAAVMPKLPESLKPAMPTRDPGDFMISHAERLVGRSLPEKLHQTAAHGLHFAYGSTFPTLLGLAAGRFRGWRDPLLAGAVLGAGVWAIGYVGWLPATGLAPRITRQGGGHALTSLMSHVLYGVVSAIPIAAGLALEGRRGRAMRYAPILRMMRSRLGRLF